MRNEEKLILLTKKWQPEIKCLNWIYNVNMTTPAVNRKKPKTTGMFTMLKVIVFSLTSREREKTTGMLTMLKVTVFILTSLFLYFVILFAYVSGFIFLRLTNVFSSPDPKGHVSYCHHLASVVNFFKNLFLWNY